MSNGKVIVITGSRKGIGRYLAEQYLGNNHIVIGCSRQKSDLENKNYSHFCLDVGDESAVKLMFRSIRKQFSGIDVLINNAGIASMNLLLLTPVSTVRQILDTNFVGTFLFCREAAKLMAKRKHGRIVNFATVAVPLQLEGEAIYASSKAAIISLSKILARELAEFNITVNVVGPTPVKTDLIRSVSADKLDALLHRQAIPRYGEFMDIKNVIDFFISEESDFITGQVVYLGGIS